MVIHYYRRSMPLVMLSTVVDDFGNEIRLIDLVPNQWGFVDAFDAAFWFAADGGACPGVHQGDLH